MKRVLAIILCAVMLVGLLPVDILAADLQTTAQSKTYYVLAGGDFQESGDHSNSAKNVADILATVEKQYPTMDGLLFVGDYDCETHGDSDETSTGINKLMETIQASYSNITLENSILVQGNHDTKDSKIDATGGHEFEGYAAYVLNEDDYPNGGGTESKIQTLANNMKTWLASKQSSNYSKPIFVVSHLPLAFNPRTNTQGDGKYAKYIFDVLNEAAEGGLNIFFLHGHNHAYGYDEYLGGHAIYLDKGDNINIAKAGSQSEYTTETLNFTYMNAGYTGYYNESGYSTSAGTDKLSMTVFAITDNQVTIGRYSADGAIDLKAAGEMKGDNIGKVSVTADTNVYITTQTVPLIGSTTKQDATTGVSVTGAGITDLKVTLLTNQTVDADKYSAYVSYDITPTGYLSGSSATVRIPLRTQDGFDFSRPVLVIDPQTNTTVERDIVGGAVTFTTNHFSTYTIAQVVGQAADTKGWQQISSASGAAGYQYVLDTDGIDRGSDNRYIIVARDAAKVLNATSTSGGTVEDATINGTTAIVDSRDYEYYFTTGNLITRDGSNTLYQQSWVIRYGYESDSNLNGFTNYGDGYYRIYDTVDTARSLYFDGTKFNVTSSNHTNQQYSVRLYKYVGEVTSVNEWAKMVVDEGIYTDFNANATQEWVESVLKDHISVYTTDVETPDDSTATDHLVSDGDVTWTWDGGFHEAGYSTLVVSYKGVELGSVTIHVAVEPGAGYSENWVLISSTPAVPGGYTYTLDTDGVNYGENYLIVAPSDSDALSNNGTSISSTSVTIDGNTITTSQIGPEWTITADGKITNGTYWLYISRSNNYNIQLSLTTNENSATEWTITHSSDGEYRIYANYSNRDRYLRYNNNSFSLSTSNNNTVRLFGGRVEQPGTEASAIYAQMDGTLEHTIAVGTMTVAQVEALIKAHITAQTASDQEGSNIIDADILDELEFTWDTAMDPSAEGNYKMTVSYQGVELGKINVCVQARQIESVEWPAEGYVDQYTTGNAYITDATGKTIMLKVKYEGEENPVEVPLTLSMIQHAGTDKAGDQSNLYVNYGSQINTGNFTLHVEAVYVNDYPEYPDEGAVKVNKTATGIDFQDTGVAQIELSTSGVPAKKGADVIVMLDTSSSMTSHNVTGTDQTRASVLEESLKNLIAQFKQNGPDGQPLDIRVAIADFNGFYGEGHAQSGTPWDRDTNDKTTDGDYSADSAAKVYTNNTNALDATAFVDAQKLQDTYTLNYSSGTNYDYAMDAIYQMGASIKQRNLENGEDRDLYVIFMSDGAAMQWNYYHSQGASANWNHWITGDWTADQWSSEQLSCTDHLYYYDNFDHDGDGYVNEHRMANAIKGSPLLTYEVIRKSTEGLEHLTNTANIHKAPSGKDNMYMVKGLGATMWSISFDATTDNKVTEESMDKSIATLASPQTSQTQYYYKVTSAQELGRAFTTIGNEIAYAATNAVFVDKMGDAFNLQMDFPPTADGGENTEIQPTIEVLTYDIWTRAEYEASLGTADPLNLDQIGTRKGTYSVDEVVMFQEVNGVLRAYSSTVDADKDGTYGVTVTQNADQTYSYAVNDTDDYIMSETAGTDANGFEYLPGVIYARSFIYNSNKNDITVNIYGRSITVAAESFYWNIGTVMTTEQALRYYVYLDGSMEGKREAGSYNTNEYAILYYDNYRGNECQQSTTSPTVAWEAANVSYAFYLVNDKGEVVVNQANGYVGSFANKLAVTRPVVYEEVLLNNDDTVWAIKITEVGGILPAGYELYDPDAQYHIEIGSGSNPSSWTITCGDGKNPTTYVTQYKIGDPLAFSKALENESSDSSDEDYTHTIVWFGVVWTPQALPDTIVIDYGLSVEISVLANDMFGKSGELSSIAQYDEETMKDWLAYTVDAEDKVAAVNGGDSVQGDFGTATMNKGAGKVTYQVDGMTMDVADRFIYSVHYVNEDNHDHDGYYYDVITVIPATTIYYEDNFVDFESYDWNTGSLLQGEADLWETVATSDLDTEVNKNQGEDRPGDYNLPSIDANNVYGYDNNKAYTTASMYSFGSAKKVTVTENTNYAIARFVFTGTGFDIISMTSNTTGVILVDIYKGEGNSKTLHKSYLVDTYYGCTYDEATKTWIYNNTVENALYQIPVIKAAGLPFDTYTVEIVASYDDAFSNGQGGQDLEADNNSYDFYLDAIRIYDPADDGKEDKDVLDAYLKDDEGWPEYHELRNKVLNAGVFNGGVASVNGLVYIDGSDPENGITIEDYQSFGPNNELYLTNGGAVAFKLGLTADQLKNVADVQIGLKSADGKQAVVSVTAVTKQGVVMSESVKSISTTTDMYYSAYAQCAANADAVVVLQNIGEGILSVTNIKITYKSNPELTETAATFAITEEEAGFAVMALCLAYEESLPTFQPESFDVKLSNSSVKAGSAVRVTVTTSKDVESLIVNGEVYTAYRENRRTEKRTWTVSLTAEEVGRLDIYVQAVNADGVASDAIVKSVEVTEQYTNIQNVISNILTGLFSKWF